MAFIQIQLLFSISSEWALHDVIETVNTHTLLLKYTYEFSWHINKQNMCIFKLSKIVSSTRKNGFPTSLLLSAMLLEPVPYRVEIGPLT